MSHRTALLPVIACLPCLAPLAAAGVQPPDGQVASERFQIEEVRVVATRRETRMLDIAEAVSQSPVPDGSLRALSIPKFGAMSDSRIGGVGRIQKLLPIERIDGLGNQVRQRLA